MLIAFFFFVVVVLLILFVVIPEFIVFVVEIFLSLQIVFFNMRRHKL